MKHEGQRKGTPPVDPAIIRETAKNFILAEFLPDEDPDRLTDTTTLISSGIIDSIGLVRLITHLEDSFGIEIPTIDVTLDNFDNLASITCIVSRKLI